MNNPRNLNDDIKKFDYPSATIGGGIMFCIYSLIKDIIGKEAWIYYIDQHWIPAYISIPLAIMFLVLFIVSICFKNKIGK